MVGVLISKMNIIDNFGFLHFAGAVAGAKGHLLTPLDGCGFQPIDKKFYTDFHSMFSEHCSHIACDIMARELD